MNWSDKSVLVTGACGTVGRTLIDKLLSMGVRRVVALDQAESGIFEIGRFYSVETGVEALVGDVRNRDSVLRGMQDVDVVFHGAALKHVNLGEMTPDEIVHTNVLGVQNMIHAARAAKVERLIFMSSDKAVNPTNVMGTSKLLSERLISAANLSASGPVFSSTRFGNVLGSSGSVVPTFLDQIKRGVDLTLTDEAMTRFVMTCNEAADLLVRAAERAEGGEVFVTKMQVMRIPDLAQSVLQLYAPTLGRDPNEVKIAIVGKRPGEKIYEELMSSEETTRVVETDAFFIIHPAIARPGLPKPDFTQGLDEYRSDHQSALDLAAIDKYLADNQIIENAV
jgi:FlaA1/EpsC-like NDP-sugar epimerase